MARITHETIKNLKPGDLEFDDDVRGFYARRQKEERKYGLKDRYRGRPVWLTIGDCSAFTPKQARAMASHFKRELRAGVDPDKLRASARGQPIIGELCDRYISEHIDVHLKPSTAVTYKHLLSAHIRPAWGASG